MHSRPVGAARFSSEWMKWLLFGDGMFEFQSSEHRGHALKPVGAARFSSKWMKWLLFGDGMVDFQSSEHRGHAFKAGRCSEILQRMDKVVAVW